MKIFSNFDTEFKDKIFKQYQEKFNDKLMLIQRNKVFLYLHVILPILMLLTIYIFFFFVVISFDFLNNSFWYTLLWFFILWSLLIYSPTLIKKIIDYYMDFVIVTPDQIISYNQTWIFTRESRSLDIDKLKTISVDKKWILKSLFNFWDIHFLSEWWDRRWDISVYYVDDPDNVKYKILEIIKKDDSNSS